MRSLLVRFKHMADRLHAHYLVAVQVEDGVGRKVADVAIEEAGDWRNGPVMSSGLAFSSAVTTSCNGCGGSSICYEKVVRRTYSINMSVA
jgi:hypothetical protein